jgi:hypothetical protein
MNWHWIPCLASLSSGKKGRDRFMKILSFLAWPLIITTVLLASCETGQEDQAEHPWPEIIGEIEITLASNQSDSIKSVRVSQIFMKHGIAMEDYRRFYQRYITENPQASEWLLGKVEEHISQEMQDYTKRQSSKMDSFRQQLKKKE